MLRGNAAVLKCQIPSFVSEYVTVSSWIISEDDNEVEIKIEDSSDLGIFVIFTHYHYPSCLSYPIPRSFCSDTS